MIVRIPTGVLVAEVVCLIAVVIAVANLGGAIGNAGRNVAAACQGQQPPHATGRP